MCGIAGRLNFRSGAPVRPDLVQGMCDLIAHRGPDGAGVWTAGAIGLGHRRLAIIDLSPAGRQPMLSIDGKLVITFNGEIYNFAELRRDLEARGHRFVSRTDTEVILAAYRQWGVGCLARLRGMFAFAIWDTDERSLFIARDRLGKKPLHYLVDTDGIAFASEPKAFLADRAFEPRPNPQAISAYLSYQYVPSPMSAFEGVQKLPPGHFLTVRDGVIKVERYWKLSYATKRQISESEACEELVARLREAVRLRLVSDVPLGAFLSGGIDSSAIVALMAGLSDTPVRTFSIGFDEKEFDELPYARLVAERYSTQHHEFVVRPQATEILDKLVWHYNEPYADPSAIPTYYLAELARRHVTVALNGDAGDENFAGYRRYVPLKRAEQFDQLPSAVRQVVGAVARRAPAPLRSDSVMYRGRRWLRRLADTPEGRYNSRVAVFDPDLKAEVCDPAFFAATDGAGSSALLLQAFAASDATSTVDALLDVDVTYYLADCLLVKVDIATMAHGLEGRSPLLDHEFMEFAASLPSDFKLRGQTTKYILKQAVRDLVPRDIIDRPKKGFGVPLGSWFRNELRELSGDLLLDGRLAARGYFKPGMVERLITEHRQGVAAWQDQLWSLLMLESWHRMFIDARPSVAPTLPEPAGVSM
ncbi:MAG: asparagine synthase (glutamine-hydrolyzing) [Acidobacteria bacterium]|nr:asparagine synthase (glutamine-hydrolyzing) [Acidobacteriota bacterium]